LKGKEPKILIDDKPVELNSQQLADLLESLPGGSVDKIELMLNPPPQFATEQGGVINIITKKGKIGLNGRLSLSAGSRGEASLQTNLNYRTGKWVLNGNVGIGGSQLNGSNYSRRSNFYTDSTNYFNTDGRFDNQSFRPNIRLQADFEWNKFSSFSSTLQSNFNRYDNGSFTAYGNINRNQELWRQSNRNNASTGFNNNFSGQVGYKLKTKKAGELLSLLVSYSYANTESNRNFLQQFLLPNTTQVLTDSTMRQIFQTTSNNYSLRADYALPIKWRKAVLSFGSTFSSNNFHNILGSANLRKTDNAFVPNGLLSNDFLFYQKIATLRSSISFSLDSTWKLTFGAQAEYTQTDFSFGNNANDYWNLLPNATLRKDFSKAINASLVYRATIRRPGITELNPSVDYNDPFNLRFGNPVLSPSLADNWDLNISYIQTKWYVNFGIGYNQLKDIFSSIRSLQADGKTYITYQNISNRKEYETTVWGGITLTKKFRLNASAGYTYNEYSSIEQQLYKYRNGGTFYTTLNYNLMFSDETSIDGNARYSNFADPQGNSRSNVSTNIGLQQKFFNKRFIVSFNIIDPFTPQQLSTFTYGSNFNVENYNSTNTKNYRITLTYQLNQVRKGKLNKLPKLTKPEEQ
jgi:ferric enterobactin receptor